MRAQKNRLTTVLIVTNVMLALAFFVTLGFVLFGASADTKPRPSSVARSADVAETAADDLIAGLHCPCEGCGHSRFDQCGPDCGEHSAVRRFVVAQLRSGTDTSTVLTQLKERFGDLTTVSSAKAAWESRHPQTMPTASSWPAATNNPPPDLMRVLEKDRKAS